MLKRKIIDKYPYILIDEYQDTSKLVIDMFISLIHYSNNCNKPFNLQFYGDSKQTIYGYGIGELLVKDYKELKIIDKLINRRSANEVISVINRIRNDKIHQESIYEDHNIGQVNFYAGTKETVNDFIVERRKLWNISKDNKLDCLVLTNRILAERSGFGSIYDFFRLTDRYSGNRRDDLNPELLSNDSSKLGRIPLQLYRVIDFFKKFQNSSTTVNDILPSGTKGASISEISKLYNSLDIQVDCSFKVNLQMLLNQLSDTSCKICQSIRTDLFRLEANDLNEYSNKLFIELYQNIDSENDDLVNAANLNIENFLNIKLSEFYRWYNLLTKNVTDEVRYHTYHGTKGLEFDNQIIIMGNQFGIYRSYFDFYFKRVTDEILDDDKEKMDSIRNLLYVACSRAIKNLHVFYIDDVSDFEAGIKSIFKTIHREY
jgi:DNA helicase-2/ATP-dependent DNA helicase PcrA